MLSELLGGLAVGDIGLAGLVILFVLSILTGKLVPKSTLDAERENRITWQEVAMNGQKAADQNSATIQEILASQRATLHAMQEIQAAGAYALAQRHRQEGES